MALLGCIKWRILYDDNSLANKISRTETSAKQRPGNRERSADFVLRSRSLPLSPGLTLVSFVVHCVLVMRCDTSPQGRLLVGGSSVAVQLHATAFAIQEKHNLGGTRWHITHRVAVRRCLKVNHLWNADTAPAGYAKTLSLLLCRKVMQISSVPASMQLWKMHWAEYGHRMQLLVKTLTSPTQNFTLSTELAKEFPENISASVTRFSSHYSGLCWTCRSKEGRQCWSFRSVCVYCSHREYAD